MDMPQSEVLAAEVALGSASRKPWTAPLVITASDNKTASKSAVSTHENHSPTSTNYSS